MHIGATIVERTRQFIALEGTPLSFEQPLAMGVQEGSVRVEAEVCALDSLGIALRGLTAWGDAQGMALHTLAETIAERITYLPERLAPIERDLERGVVQMRSAPPLVENSSVEYYEITLTRSADQTRMHLARYRREDGQRRRRSVPIVLTHGLFQRLADDLAALLHTPDTA